MQVHGGMGYIEETGAAQLFRDSRIAAIYEGTNGIQAIDLVQRKLPLSGGATVKREIADMRAVVAEVAASGEAEFGATAARLGEAVDALEQASAYLGGALGADPAVGARRRDALSQAVRPGARRRLPRQGGARRACAEPAERGRIGLARFFAEKLATAAPGLAAFDRVRRRAARRLRSDPRGERMSEFVQVDRDGAVLVVTLARPEKKNALTGAMYEALIAAFAEASDDAEIGALLIEGSGGVFSAGNDIGDFLACALRAGAAIARRAGHALHLRAGALRQAAGRRGRRAGGRHRHDAVLPLRSRLRQPERALPHAVRRSRPGAGSGLVAARAAALRPRARRRISAARRAVRRRGGARPAAWSTPSSTPRRCTPMRSPRRKALAAKPRQALLADPPPHARRRDGAARAHGRGSEAVRRGAEVARGARRVHGVHEPAEGLERAAFEFMRTSS